MVGPHSLFSTDLAVSDPTHQNHQLQRRLGKIDLAPEQCQSSPVPSAWLTSSKVSRVVPAPPPSTPTINVGVVADKLFQALGPLNGSRESAALP